VCILGSGAYERLDPRSDESYRARVDVGVCVCVCNYV
jgi:hypothetical protein